MASPVVYSAGFNLSGTVFQNGPALLQLVPAYLSGAVQWLDTLGGDNANAGTDPELPVATLAQAVTNSAANGMIVIGEGSVESLSGTQTLSLAGLTVIGCGGGSSRPRYTNAVVGNMFNVTGAGVNIQNLYFPAGTAVGVRVNVGAANAYVRECYFECGTSDSSTGALVLGASSTSGRVEDCTFQATAARPSVGLAVTSAVTDLDIRNTTFDGGSYGWTDYAFKVSAAATRMRLEGVVMQNRSDFGATVTATSYKIFGLTVGQLSRVVLTA